MNNIKSFTLLVFVTPLFAFAQHDYLKMNLRDSFISCDIYDSAKTVQAIQRFKSQNVDSILFNLHVYYRDLGMLYYKRYLNCADNSFLELAIQSLNSSIKQDSTYYLSYWDASIMYYLLGNCQMTNDYMNQYKKLAPKKQWDKTSMNVIKKKCVH